ncbi:ALAAT2 [Symbiodinium sp. CCMP2456]|nr:ALAAT2 [Symbiodinium sp. CCMP2456]
MACLFTARSGSCGWRQVLKLGIIRPREQRRPCGSVTDRVVQHARAVLCAGASAGSQGPAIEKIIPLHSADAQFVRTILSQHEVVARLVAGDKEVSVTSPEANSRARSYLDAMQRQEGIANGPSIFRESVANFVTHRDDMETSPDSIVLTSGSWPSARALLQVLLGASEDAVVLLPSPGPPAYRETSASMGQLGVSYLVDDNDWDRTVSELGQTLHELRQKQRHPRALVVANPSLSGRLIAKTAIDALLELAHGQGLAIIAQEDNLATRGLSFRNAAKEIGLAVPVFSCFSACAYTGQDGGYIVCDFVPHDMISHLHAVVDCPTLKSQAWLASLLSPWTSQESCLDKVVQTADRNAQLLSKLAGVEGIRCPLADSGAYALPRIIVKGFVMKKAISLATPADQIYCLEMVSRTGVIASPGSGFGQRPGFFHFRISLMHKEATFVAALEHIKAFHAEHPTGWFR